MWMSFIDHPTSKIIMLMFAYGGFSYMQEFNTLMHILKHINNLNVIDIHVTIVCHQRSNMKILDAQSMVTNGGLNGRQACILNENLPIN